MPRESPPRPTRGRADIVVVAALAAIVLGVLFRVVQLDGKVYWLDEVFTSLALAGYSNEDALRELGDGRPRRPSELRRYQGVDHDGSGAHTLGLLTRHNPHQAPLYPVLARSWATWTGDGVLRLRALSAIFSLLAIAAFGWVSHELFGDRRTTTIGLGLVAVSPIVVLYAQEARAYALWSLLVLLATGCLLRAQRLDTRRAWGLYSLALTLALYTQVLTVLVVLAHAVSVAFRSDPGTRRRWGQAAGLALVAFGPWLLNLAFEATTAHRQLRWAETVLTPTAWVSRATAHYGSIFADLRSHTGPGWEALPILGLIVWAACHRWPATPATRRALLLALLVVPWLGLALPDVALGGRRATIARYLIPSYLAAQLLVARLLADRTRADERPRRWHSWSLGSILLLGVGVLSCARSATSETWWTKSISMGNADVARALAASEHPIVLVPASRTHMDVLALAADLPESVRIIFLREGTRPELPGEMGTLFLFGPLPPPFAAPVVPGYGAVPVGGAPRLWRLHPRNGANATGSLS